MNDIYQYLIAAKTLVEGISNNKVANFAYTQTAYTEDTVDGVTEYSYGNDQNIPLGSHTDLDQNVRDKGIRSQAASLPRNAINHFFGRVSYNLNKITDTLNSFIAQITRAFTQNGSFYSALAEYKQYDTCTMLVTEDGGNLLKMFLRTSSVPEVIQGVIPISGGVINTEHWKLTYSTDTVTQLTTDSSTKIASTELVDNKIAAYNSLVNAALATKANLESPAFTGSPTVNGETILHSGSTIVADTAALATLATQALAIKPLGNSITLAATPTSVTKIIKIATVGWNYNGLINISCAGSSIEDGIKVYITGANAPNSGLRVLYGKVGANFGIKKIIVTCDTEVFDSNRNLYAEIKTYPNYVSTTTLGVVETNKGLFTPSMTEVLSVEGIVVDSLVLDYQRGDISSYQHVFTKYPIAPTPDTATNNTQVATTAFVKNQNYAVGGIDFVNGAAGTFGSVLIDGLSSWIIPKGTYMLTADNNFMLGIRGNETNSWQNHGNAPSGLMISDGVHYRIYNSLTGNSRLYYRKLA